MPSPLIGVVLSMSSENNRLPRAIPGGLIDPSLTQADHLVGGSLSRAWSMSEIHNGKRCEYDKIKMGYEKWISLIPLIHVPPTKKKKSLNDDFGSNPRHLRKPWSPMSSHIPNEGGDIAELRC